MIKKIINNNGVISALENILNSLVSLIISLSLINLASDEEYGQFTIVFVSATLLLAICTSLFHNQIAVLSAKKKGIDKDYSVSTLFILFILVVLILAFTVFVIVNNVLHWAGGVFIFAYIFLYNLREGLKNILYMEGRSIAALFSTGVMLCVIVFAQFLVFIDVVSFDYSYFYSVLSFIYAVSVVISFLLVTTKISIKMFSISSFNESWIHSKWSFVGGLGAWGQNNGYAYIIGYFFGPAIVAIVSATKLSMMPLNVLVNGFFSGVRSKFSRDYDLNSFSVRKKMTLLYMGIVVCCFFYTMFLIFSWDLVNYYIFKSKFNDAESIVVLWGAFFIFQTLRLGVTNYMQLGLKFKLITLHSLPVNFLSILSMVIVSIFFDYRYVIGIMCFFEIGLLYLLYRTAR